jgi:hypothetical protein
MHIPPPSQPDFAPVIFSISLLREVLLRIFLPQIPRIFEQFAAG